MAPLKPRLPKGLLKKVPLRNNWGETFGVPQNCPKGKDLNPCPVQETRNVIKDLTVKGDKIELRGPRKVAPSLSWTESTQGFQQAETPQKEKVI